MKKIIQLIRSSGRGVIVLLLLSAVYPCAAGKLQQITIVSDARPGAPAQHGLDKLTAALTGKHIAFEKVNTVKEATAKQIIVAGLAAGDGAAATLLKAAHHSVP